MVTNHELKKKQLFPSHKQGFKRIKLRYITIDTYGFSLNKCKTTQETVDSIHTLESVESN
jgi:hypothetical protein